MIYLDNNASTPVDPEVSDAIFSCLKRDFGNPSSSHIHGRRAREVLETSANTLPTFWSAHRRRFFSPQEGLKRTTLPYWGQGCFIKLAMS